MKWTPPPCLDGASIFMLGFSEIGRYWTWMQRELNCTLSEWSPCVASRRAKCPRIGLDISHATHHCYNAGYQAIFGQKAARRLKVKYDVRIKSQINELRDGLCRERVYGDVGGLNASCTTAFDGREPFKISYRWKTFQTDKFDAADRMRIMHAAQRHQGHVIVILEGGGPHHFAKFVEHFHARQGGKRGPSLFTVVNDTWRWPQYWIDDYMRGTKQLMQRHAWIANASSNVCVLWKAMHIGPRDASPARRLHHPSVVDNINHRLNRLAVSAAREIPEMRVVDLSDLTMQTSPSKKLSGAHKANTSEGDPYHGYSHAWLTPILMDRICEACSSKWARHRSQK